MKNFFRSFLASLLAFLVAGIILIFVFVAAMIGSIAGSSASMFSGGTDNAKVKDNSVLHIKFDKPIVDRAKDNPFENFDFGSMSVTGSMGLNKALKAIHRAKEDDKIKGIYLDIAGMQAGMATMEEIRSALLDFKLSGKWIISYSELYSQSAYYIASVADDIYIYPEGMLDFRGFRSEIAFMKGALEKLEIEAQIIRGRNNKFKSAVEPLMYDHMSDANREQMNKYVGSLWNHYVSAISASRKISEEELNEIADSLYVRDAKDAVTY
ncbi:MAG: S49 family peptidase, partial [Flavobacteriales bacterium]